MTALLSLAVNLIFGFEAQRSAGAGRCARAGYREIGLRHGARISMRRNCVSSWRNCRRIVRCPGHAAAENAVRSPAAIALGLFGTRDERR